MSPIHQDPFAVNDFFFRTADRMRVEGCANAIANEGLSLVLYCQHEPLLDHYLQLLLERLRRQTPEPRLEVYFPTNADALIARFNDVLAQQSVKEATVLPEEQQSAQIWIVHDTQQLPDAEIQLMARLIQNFPGANIRAILLMTGSQPQKASLSAFGRKVLRWDIEAPNPEQAQLALDSAAQSGQLQTVTQLLRRIGGMPAAAAITEDIFAERRLANPKPSTPLAWLKQAPTGLGKPQQWLNQLKGKVTNWPTAWTTRNGKSPALLLGAAGAALLVSVGVVAWLQPHAFGLAPQPQPQVAIATPKALEAVAQPPVAAPAVAAKAASETAPEVPDESQQSQAWVRSLPAASFLIQHGSVATYLKAADVKKGVPAKGQARIVAAYRSGESLAHFVVVSGPFDNLGQAYESIKRKEATPNSWVRATRTLQDQMDAHALRKEIRP